MDKQPLLQGTSNEDTTREKEEVPMTPTAELVPQSTAGTSFEVPTAAASNGAATTVVNVNVNMVVSDQLLMRSAPTAHGESNPTFSCPVPVALFRYLSRVRC